MSDQQPIYLADYQPPAHLVSSVHLTFHLSAKGTRVISRIAFTPNPNGSGGPLELDGVGLKLIWARIDDTPVDPRTSDTGLSCTVPETPFVWEAEVEIDPEANTALEGLYMSKGMFCTQCEAEGFRKITYYPDRPDVMAPFTVRLAADLPVLLSNGNPTASGPGWAEWHDPWPKPAYLFALVAGDLVATKDRFTTASGAPVDLNIWVRAGDEGKTAYAMDALKRSMRWDEEVYGREYDLDVFNIVAVDDFNMGAMENKGLNIFNSKYVLASPETATDRDYELIEGIIAHEYFHNWTGNRITCRDWFQLCLKEGLTVFRDQQFSGDMRSHAVKRIDDVLMLRARQFREDAGPLAHPVRPESFVEINNFYTATVYEKGAEVIGMLKTLVGDAVYATALDLYFERHDGDAATIEDWLSVFEEASGRDLTEFKRWYSQAGTPKVSVSEKFEGGTYTLTFNQDTAPTPGHPDKATQVIPIAVGLLSPDGRETVPTTVLELTGATQSFAFKDLSERPIPSILRNFSAPVILDRTPPPGEALFLLKHDSDPFNRWEAGRRLIKDALVGMITNGTEPGTELLQALGRVIRDTSADPAFRALNLALPSEDDLAQTLFDAGHTPDPDQIHGQRRKFREALGRHLKDDFEALYTSLRAEGTYSPDAASAGRRSLRLAALGLLTPLDEGNSARTLFAEADNMTEQLGALSALLVQNWGQEELAVFYDTWRSDRLVMDKWFALQTSLAVPGKAAEVTQSLTQHPDFDWKNPNRFRSAAGGLVSNAAGFHNPTGAGYRLLADWLIRLDPVNPQTAARMCAAFETWHRYDADRQELIKGELDRIASQPELSRDTAEMVGRIRDG